MYAKASQALSKEAAIRNLKASIDMLSTALERFDNENGPDVWSDLNETLRIAERDMKVTRLILY